MPRIGINPNRGQQTDYRPSRITLAMLTYLPNQAGYFAQRLAVTRLSLESLIAHTPKPFDLIVFDNGSCPDLVSYLCHLRDEGLINYLILSPTNIGKVGALQVMFRAAPGEIIAYTDDDILFLPGWLDEHLKLLETFPNVGLVTGFYIRSHMRYATQSLEKIIQSPEITVKRGMLIQPELEQHYIDNMGRTWESYTQEVQGLEDVQLSFHGVDALASAGHHQFVAEKQLLLKVLPAWDGQLMGKMLELETNVDQLGYLRLSTCTPVTRLLGNVISSENAEEARRLGLNAQAGKSYSPRSGLAGWLSRIPGARRVLGAIYTRVLQGSDKK
jgi:Glycosyl transferase family 2